MGSKTYVYSDAGSGALTETDRATVLGASKYDIELPENVQVGTFGLIGMKVDNSDSMWSKSTTVHINTTKDKITDYVVGENAINCVIQLPNGSRYVQQGAYIYELTDEGISRTPVNENALAATKNADNYTFEVESNNFKYDASTNTIYVAYNSEELSINLSNIVAADGSKLSINGAKFTLNLASGETVTQEENSLSNSTKITIPETAKDFTLTTKIAGCTKTVNVKVVRVSKVYFTDADLAGFNFTLDNTNTIPDMSITIPYSSLEYDPISIKPTYELNYPDCGVKLEPEISITGSDSFTYTYEKDATSGEYEGTLTVNNTIFGSKNFNFTITCDDVTNTATYSVTLKDVSASPFTKSDAVTTVETYKDVNDAKMIYHVGNKDTLPLNYLVKLASGKTIPSGRKIFVDFYSGATKLRDTQEFTSTSGAVAMPTTVTGTVTMKVGIGGETFDLSIKIVDGKNVLDLAGWEAVGSTTGIVLHSDLTISYNADKASGKAMDAKYSKNMGGKTLSGNMHKIIVPSFYVTAKNNNYFISMSGGKVENIAIEGPSYGTNVSTTQSEGGSMGTFVSAIESSGVTINNSYIAGFRQTVRSNGGTVTISNSTLKGGNWATVYTWGNKDNSPTTHTFNLSNVTMIQYLEDGAFGVGFFLDSDAAVTVNLVDGYFKQYNYMTESDATKMSFVLDKLDYDLTGDIEKQLKNKIMGMTTIQHGNYVHGGFVLDPDAQTSLTLSDNLASMYSSKQTISYKVLFVTTQVGYLYGYKHQSSGCTCGSIYSETNAYLAQTFLNSRK